MADRNVPVADAIIKIQPTEEQIEDLKYFSKNLKLNTPSPDNLLSSHESCSTRDSGYLTDQSSKPLDNISRTALEDAEIERLLGFPGGGTHGDGSDQFVPNATGQKVDALSLENGSEACSGRLGLKALEDRIVPEIPGGFNKVIQGRLAHGHITPSVACFYLERLPQGDSLQIPGQYGRPSVLEAMLTGDIANLEKDNAGGFGWVPIRHLGTGTYGSVILWRKVRETRPPLFLAVKSVFITSFYQDYCSEAHLTRRLNDLGCRNVISVVEWKYLPEWSRMLTCGEVVRREPRHCIAYEFAKYGDLIDLSYWYKERSLIFPEAFIWHVFHSMATALCFCHHGINGPVKRPGWDSIVHGDVKLDNIFLTTVDPYQSRIYPSIKLADFGLSWAFSDSVPDVQHYNSVQKYGTYGCMAPEVLNQSPEKIEKRRRRPHELHGPHSDIFSLGMTMCQCFSLLTPYLMAPACSPEAAPLAAALLDDESLLSFYSPQLRDLVERCKEIDPRNRPKTYTLYRETKAASEFHRDQAEDNGVANMNHMTSSTVLFAPELQQHYDIDETFRWGYRNANLQPLLTHLENERDRNTFDENLHRYSVSAESNRTERNGTGSTQKVTGNGDKAFEKTQLRGGMSALWREINE